MANMIITQDIENILKRKYAELNKVTPKTWKSSEFLAWRHKEIEKINQTVRILVLAESDSEPD